MKTKLLIAVAMIVSFASGYTTKGLVRHIQKEISLHNELVAEYCEQDEACYINHRW